MLPLVSGIIRSVNRLPGTNVVHGLFPLNVSVLYYANTMAQIRDRLFHYQLKAPACRSPFLHFHQIYPFGQARQ